MDLPFLFLTIIGLLNLTPTNGQIQCKTYDDAKLICSAQNTENILKKNFISDYNNVTEISLNSCGIIDIDIEAFKNYVNFKYVDLSRNRLTELKPGLLDDCTKVTYLNLSLNKLTTLPVDIFENKLELEVLDLSKNKIDYLPIGLFDTVKNLTYLDLSNNMIVGEDMTPRIFEHITTIRHLDFSRNYLSGTSSIVFQTFTNLETLILHKCLLDEIPNFIIKTNLKTVKDLVLSTNHIGKLVDNGIFKTFLNLEQLNLADNVIDEIDEEVFSPLKKLKTLVLKKNRLEILPNNLFQSLKSLENLDLSYNDVEYVPLSAFSGTKLKMLNLSYNRFSFLDSRFLFQLKNTGIRLEVFYFNDNPWQCACLNEILVEAKLYEITYESIKYKGFHPVCVTSREFVCNRDPDDNSHFVNMYQNDILIDR